jgi:HEAT repeat protein
MQRSPRTLPALALAGGLLVAAALLQIPSAGAQDPPEKARPEKTDPVEAFQDALDQDLDNLPGEDERDRAAIRKKILDHRQQMLTELADKIVTLRDLSRALRIKGSERLKEKENKDLRLYDIDDDVFKKLMQRFVVELKKVLQSEDLLTQRAAATLAGDFVSDIYSERRGLIGRAVIDELVPELARLAGKTTDPGVEVSIARSLGNIVLELKDGLTPKANDAIRTAIGQIQKAKSPEPRRAVIDTAGALVKLLNPDPGEEKLQPTIAKREDLISLMGLTPILFRGLADTDAITHKKAIFVLARLVSLLTKDRQILILTAPLAPPPPGRKPDAAEEKVIKANMERLERELEAMRKHLEPFWKQRDVFVKALNDSDPEVRLAALRALEDLAILQGYVYERMGGIPDVKPDGKEGKDEAPPAPGMFFEPLFTDATPLIVKNMKDRDYQIRIMATQVLECRGPLARDQGPALVETLRDSNPFVRWVAARTLGRLNQPAVKGAAVGLAGLANDEDLSVRIAVANAIESLGSEGREAVPALLRVVNTGDGDFREAALKALGAAGPYTTAHPLTVEKRGKLIVPALVRELSNPDVQVRRAAAQALGRFPADVALAAPALKKALDDEDSEVRRYATEALLSR